MQPYYPGQGSISHLCSLAVEEQFHLLWPQALAHFAVMLGLSVVVAWASYHGF